MLLSKHQHPRGTQGKQLLQGMLLTGHQAPVWSWLLTEKAEQLEMSRDHKELHREGGKAFTRAVEQYLKPTEEMKRKSKTKCPSWA